MDSMLERLMPKEWDKRNTVTELRTLGPIDTSGWYSAKYKAHNKDFSAILWPEFKDEAWLRNERESYKLQGLLDIYSQEYLNIPIDESTAFFRRSDFSAIKEEEKETELNYYLSCDLAVSLKNSSDYTVFVISGMDQDGKLHVKDVVKERIDSLEIVDNILALNKKYDFDFCVFEKGAITSTILPMLNIKMIEENNYITTHFINPSTDKVSRAQSIRARMRSGGVKFLKGADWFPDLEQELMRFPRDAHDDQVDALSLLGLALDKFAEAPTEKEMLDSAREEEMHENGLFSLGRSTCTGY